jgi:predicted DsbA family dithiol-disulfide isomerase
MEPRIPILCFTDVLCGFCYLADARLEQLKSDFGDRVELSYHFMAVYGDVRRRLDNSGKSDSAYGAMVRDIVESYGHVDIHADIFRKQIPASCLPAHLYLRAVKLLQDEGRLPVDELAARHGIASADVSQVIDDGRAYAELAHDAELQRKYNVLVTPSLVLNEGRQLLNGNVGYRVIEANIRELLANRTAEMSWC